MLTALWVMPATAPGVAPDLAASRAIIDRLNGEMVEQVGRQREIEAAGRAARLAHHLDASRQVVIALFGVDHNVSGDNHHCVPPYVCPIELSPDMTAFRVGIHRISGSST